MGGPVDLVMEFDETSKKIVPTKVPADSRSKPLRNVSHRVRLENLKRFKKNLIKNGSLDKKLGQKENRSVKIFEIENF